MDRQILDLLIRRMEDAEKTYADGGVSHYSRRHGLYIKRGTVMKPGELISILPHPRFVPIPRHRHNYIEMMHVCRGTITHVINGADVVMEAGDILLLNQHISHSIRTSGRDDVAVNIVVLPEFFETAMGMLEKNNFLADFIIDLLRRKSGASQYLHFKLSGNLQTGNMMENLIHSLTHRRSAGTRINQILMGLLFLYLLENTEALRRDAPNNHREILSRSVLRYIEQNFKTATLSEIAADMHFPLAYLSRFVLKTTGRTFKDLLQERRFGVALDKLAETTLPVGDILAAVGYEGSSYFFRRFRQKYGMSPKEYRKQKRGGAE